MTIPDWSFQTQLCQRVIDALETNRTTVMAAPTGSGKAKMCADIIEHYARHGARAIVVTERRVLLDQLYKRFYADGFSVGSIAAGRKLDLTKQMHVAMAQTLYARLPKNAKLARYVANADIVFYDEAHRLKAKSAAYLFNAHSQAKVCGMTATPVGLGGLYDSLVLGPSPTELEACGVLVPVHIYAPSEIDMKGVAKVAGEFSAAGIEQRLRQLQGAVIGQVVGHYEVHNQDRYPAICFGPNVAGSKWLSEQFGRAGVASDHVDGTTPENIREHMFSQWNNGDLQIVCSCQVLREGFDFPELRFASDAQPNRLLHNWLQKIGRIRRAAEGKTHAVWMDHAGNWWRHPQGLQFWDWRLEEDGPTLRERLAKENSEPSVPQPITCYHCNLVWTPSSTAKRCPGCGYEATKHGRIVMMKNGRLERKQVDPREDEMDMREIVHMAIATAKKHDRTCYMVAEIFKSSLGRYPTDEDFMPYDNPTDRSVCYRRAKEVYRDVR